LSSLYRASDLFLPRNSSIELTQRIIGITSASLKVQPINKYNHPPITHHWTGLLILDHSYLVGNVTNSKISETTALEPLKSWHFCKQFLNLLISQWDMSSPRLGALSNYRWSWVLYSY
jgi:hypothetical protein